MTLCSSALRWANFTPRPHVWEYSGLPDHNPVVVSFHIHATMGRFDNGNYLAHWNTNQCSHIKANLSACSHCWWWWNHAWQLVDLCGSCLVSNPTILKTWNYEQIRGAEVKPCLPKIFLLFVPHVILMIGNLSKVKILRGENAFSVLYKIKLRQNRRLQHLKCLYSQMDRRHSKQYEDEIDR